MRSRFLLAACLAAVLSACFGKAIYQGEQFAYRDAAHFYYPLYERVQREWDAGRWPLWAPEENAGMPLMGNPTAAVLYPGKVIYAVLPYPVAARAYVIAHVLLAFLAMYALVRSWGTGVAGSGIAALGYAFGGPILFQYCNIIYLVGAAWAPLGLRAADRWLRLGNRRGLLELAGVLALETLGGDPEVAYLTGLCAGGYALALARTGRRQNAGDGTGFNLTPYIAGAVLFAAWVGTTLAMAQFLPALRPPKPSNQPTRPFVWMPWVAPLVAGVWGCIGIGLIARWRKRFVAGDRPVLIPMLAGLAGAAVLAGMLTSAQLLPVMEFTGQSGRAAGEGPHDIYPFSLEPARVVEFLWPNLFGTPYHGNRSWLAALPPGDKSVKVWVPTLYLGGLTIVLALSSITFRFRDQSPWRAWLSLIAVLSLVASFGEFASPTWWARLNPGLAAEAALGPHDSNDVAAIRMDGHLRDGDGSLYWLLATALPGFRQFRFPSKLLTFTALALTALAGLGWDALVANESRARSRTALVAGVLLLLSLTALGTVFTFQRDLVAWLSRQPLSSVFGPLDAPGAMREMLGGLVQGTLVIAASLGLVLGARQRPGLVSALAVGLLGADVSLANARYVLTLPQSYFESEPEILAVIKAAEKKDPSDGPYRVHRMPFWDPVDWTRTASEDRVRDFVRWERDTLQPKYGINLGVDYTMTLGVAELYDYEWFFGGFYRTVDDQVARSLSVKPGHKVVAFSRRAFDMWNTRYFVVPFFPGKWNEEQRGYATFLQDSDRIYPPSGAFDGPERERKELDWVKTHDVQVFRNKTPYPRAWVAHEARYMPPIRGLTRAERDLPMQEILFSNDMLWRDPNRTVYDPKRIVWVDSEDRQALAPLLPGGTTARGETVKVVKHEPHRVELEATLERPGMVVLADIYYPGWTLKVDGKTAPIFRANRMMRGAALPAGTFRLVYTYEPKSFRIGLIVSCVGLALVGIMGVVTALRPHGPGRGYPTRPGDAGDSQGVNDGQHENADDRGPEWPDPPGPV